MDTSVLSEAIRNHLHLNRDELKKQALPDRDRGMTSITRQHIATCFSCRMKVRGNKRRSPLGLTTSKISVEWGESPKVWINSDAHRLAPQAPSSTLALVQGLSLPELLAYREADVAEPGEVMLGVEIEELALVTSLSRFNKVTAAVADDDSPTSQVLPLQAPTEDPPMITEVLSYGGDTHAVKFAHDQQQAVFLEVTRTDPIGGSAVITDRHEAPCD